MKQKVVNEYLASKFCQQKWTLIAWMTFTNAHIKAEGKWVHIIEVVVVVVSN